VGNKRKRLRYKRQEFTNEEVKEVKYERMRKQKNKKIQKKNEEGWFF
jgi:hypothetical protein